MYENETRNHYRAPVVADNYAQRLSVTKSPIDFFVGVAERWQISRAAASLGARFPHILDVPAGTGKLSNLLSKRASTYLAVDISEAMLSYAQQAGCKAVADASKLPFGDSSISLVVSLRLMHRVPDPNFGEILQELLRVAGRGLVVSYASTPPLKRTLRSVQRLLGRAPLTYARSKSDFEEYVTSAGSASVTRDRSINWLSSERIATITIDNSL